MSRKIPNRPVSAPLSRCCPLNNSTSSAAGRHVQQHSAGNSESLEQELRFIKRQLEVSTAEKVRIGTVDLSECLVFHDLYMCHLANGSRHSCCRTTLPCNCVAKMPSLSGHTIQFSPTKRHFFVALMVMRQGQRAPLRCRSYGTDWFSSRRSKSVLHSQDIPT